ncbi:RNAse HI [Haloarcula californiae tailed virus 1]|uniref:RNAse HI n=1 Tax=Haloarcula californiae tailed virus 1 TaxID=1273746 RepID=R4TMM2_9CAUD|nr:Rnase H [Haloarcula californiae tailed virus 1]AGM11992.1 RNAse HI [Haloarcula californiae tailed virus 1]UBF23121.1 RNase H1 [Haloarcula virus HCTV-16]
MTYLVLKTDASVRYGEIIGLGYALERVNEDGTQEEVLFKECEETTLNDTSDEQRVINEAEYLAIVYGVRRTLDEIRDDESLEIRCDNNEVVRAVQGQRTVGTFEAQSVHQLLSDVDWRIERMSRRFNSVADSLSKQASRDKVR